MDIWIIYYSMDSSKLNHTLLFKKGGRGELPPLVPLDLPLRTALALLWTPQQRKEERQQQRDS